MLGMPGVTWRVPDRQARRGLAVDRHRGAGGRLGRVPSRRIRTSVSTSPAGTPRSADPKHGGRAGLRRAEPLGRACPTDLLATTPPTCPSGDGDTSVVDSGGSSAGLVRSASPGTRSRARRSRLAVRGRIRAAEGPRPRCADQAQAARAFLLLAAARSRITACGRVEQPIVSPASALIQACSKVNSVDALPIRCSATSAPLAS